MTLILLLWILFIVRDLQASNITDNVVYVGEGESITLKCPFFSSSHVITWFGPPNLTIYSDGFKTSRHFNHFSITGDFIKGEYNIIILNVTTSYIGCYRCSTIVNNRSSHKDFNMILKRPPTNLRIINIEPAKFIKGTEGQLITLTCMVDSGTPLQTLVWKLNGNVLATNQTDALTYSFIPERSDHLQFYHCCAYHSELNFPLEERVQLLLKYKPQVRIAQGSNAYITEGQNLKLSCIVDSIPRYENISWVWENGDIMKNDNILSLQVVNRRESGTYTCYASNTIGTGFAYIYVLVLYPPDLTIEKFISTGSVTLRCNARGVPSNESFYPWQHLSDYGTFIRYLPSASDGTLNIKQNTYATSGRYVCTSTNGVPDVNGVKNKSASIDIKNKDIPIFVSDNKNIQYAKINHDSIMTVNIYSYPPLLAVTVKSDNGIFFNSTDSFLYRYVWITDTIFGTKVDLNGTSVYLKIQNIQDQYFGNYMFFVQNERGGSNFTVRLMPSDPYLSFRLWFSILAPGSVGFCIIIIALALIVICARRHYKIYILRKQRQSHQQHDHIYFEIDESNVVQNVIDTEINDRNVNQDEIERTISNEHIELNDVTSPDEDGVINNRDSDQSRSTSGSSSEIVTIRSLPEDYAHPYHTLVKENLRLSVHEYESLRKPNICVVQQNLKKYPRRNSI